MMQELQKLYADIPVPPTLKEDILTYCRTAEEKPAPFIVRYAKPLALAAACVAVLTVSLAMTGKLFDGSGLPLGTSSESTSSVGEELTPESAIDSNTQETATTTRASVATRTTRATRTTSEAQSTGQAVTTTTAHFDGTGGDEDSCDKHVMFYHNFDGRLIDYVGSDKVEAYVKENGWDNTYYLTGEEREEFNVVNFIRHFGITKQEFIAAMGWEDVLDEKPDAEEIGIGYFNDQYTYREQVDALYSGDQELIDWVFHLEIIEVSTTTTTTATTTEAVSEPTASVSLLEPINGTTSTRGAYNPK